MSIQQVDLRVYIDELECHFTEQRVCEITSLVLIKELTQFDRQTDGETEQRDYKLTLIRYADNRTHSRSRSSHNCNSCKQQNFPLAAPTYERGDIYPCNSVDSGQTTPTQHDASTHETRVPNTHCAFCSVCNLDRVGPRLFDICQACNLNNT